MFVGALFQDFVTQLVKHCIHNSFKEYHVYAHNLGAFDGILLFHHLYQFGEVSPLFNNGKLMSSKLVIEKNNKIFNNEHKITIVFKDSFLMLPMSLRKLCVAFNIPSIKSFFPFYVKDVFYKDLLPAFEYWTGISSEGYSNLVSKYTGKTWDFKEEAIKYCKIRL